MHFLVSSLSEALILLGFWCPVRTGLPVRSPSGPVRNSLSLYRTKAKTVVFGQAWCPGRHFRTGLVSGGASFGQAFRTRLFQFSTRLRVAGCCFRLVVGGGILEGIRNRTTDQIVPEPCPGVLLLEGARRHVRDRRHTGYHLLLSRALLRI